MAHLEERDVLARTVYGEARGEPLEGQQFVAWVIKNRAHHNKSYWGGGNIKNVCLHPWQFECWTNHQHSLLNIDDWDSYNRIRGLTDAIYDAPQDNDPTGGCDHFNNPDKEGYPSWVQNVDQITKIGGHVFYRTKPGF